MSCDGGHLGFPIGIKKRNLVKDIPMIIHLQFGFNRFISFREEDLWNFSQSEHIIGLGSHIKYPTGTKNSNFVEDHPMSIPAKFGSNRPSGFGEEAWNVKGLQTTDDGRQAMAIVHLDLWSRWTNKKKSWEQFCLWTNLQNFPIHVIRALYIDVFLYPTVTIQASSRLKRSANHLWNNSDVCRKKFGEWSLLSLRRGLNLEKSTHYLSIYLQRIKKPKGRHMKRRDDRGGPLIENGRTKWTNKWRLDIKILIRGIIKSY